MTVLKSQVGTPMMDDHTPRHAMLDQPKGGPHRAMVLDMLPLFL